VKRLYTVKRLVRESYEVELDTVSPPTRDQIKDAAIDPYGVEVLRETVRPVKDAAAKGAK